MIADFDRPETRGCCEEKWQHSLDGSSREYHLAKYNGRQPIPACVASARERFRGVVDGVCLLLSIEQQGSPTTSQRSSSLGESFVQ